MTHRIAVSLVATLAAGCNDKLTSDDADPGDYTCPGGCVYLTLDNAELTNDSLLLQQESDGIFERSERTEDAWHYRAFEFKIAQSGHNLSRGTDSATSLTVWPSQPGVVDPPEGSTAPFTWTIPGAKVGYSDLTMTVSKQRTVRKPYGHTEITQETEATKLRLRPDIILVPIQVAQFTANYSGAQDPRTTDVFNEPRSRLFFDDAWIHSVQRSSYEGLLEDLVGHWEDRNTDGYSPWAASYAPDRIFQQCGIQFRMVKHVEVTAEKEYWEMADANGNKHCDNFADAKLRTMRDASVAAGLRADVPILLLTRVLMHPSCNDYDQVHGAACNSGSCGGANWAAIGRYHLGDVGNQYVISHELGHVLGVADLPSGNPICSGDNKHLMCQFTSRQAGELRGGPPGASCEGARQVAAAYANRYFDTTGTDF